MYLVLLIVVIFLETARMLLPWMICSTVFSIVIIITVSRVMRATSNAQWPIYGLASFALTLSIGYLGFWLLPPALPAEVPKEKLPLVVEFLLGLPNPNINRDALLAMLPVHLGISGCISALIVEGLIARRNSRRKVQEA